MAVYFKAMLTDANDKLIEYGKAVINHERRTIDFVSSFIPIINMGTDAKIFRMCGEIAVQSFCGKVYLSSQKLLRIEADLAEDLSEIDVLYNINEELPAKAKNFTLCENATYANRPVDIMVYSLSAEFLKFTCKTQFCIGQRLSIDITSLLQLSQEVVVVPQKIINLSDGFTSYICDVAVIYPETVQALKEYAMQKGRFI